MSSSDEFDDGFFNAEPSDVDFKDDLQNVIVSSKNSIVSSPMKKVTPKIDKSSHSPVMNKKQFNNDFVNISDGSDEEDIEVRKNEKNETMARGRKRTRNKRSSKNKDEINNFLVSLSSSSLSRSPSMSRSSSNSNSNANANALYSLKRQKSDVNELFDTKNVLDDDEKFFQELEKTKSTEIDESNKASLSPSHPSSSDSPASLSVLSNQKRIYKIRFISKLDGTINKNVQVKVLGKFTFQKILPAALEGYRKAFKLPNVMRSIYDPENVVLYRNNIKLLNFMNCNSLNIPQSFENEISDVEIVLVSKDKESDYEMEIYNKSVMEDDEIENTNTVKPSDNDEREESLEVEEYERELGSGVIDSRSPTTNIDIDTNADREEREAEPLMKIALLGQDNKKITVNVRNSTPFSKLVDYYRKQKILPKSAKITLMFDHEALDLNETVQDQDMEDDDVIDVVVK